MLAGLAIVFVAVLSLLASAPARAAEGCSATSLYVVAHQDDTLLFQSPTLVQDIQSSRCVRTVFLTAGDDGKEQPYWLGREEGAQAAYAQMAGVANQWTASTTTVAGHLLRVATLTAKPSISIYYLRLPDGGIEGEGSMLYGFKSLLRLWESGQPGSTSPPQDATIEAVDHSATYTYAGLVETLKGLMTQLEPQQVLTQNYMVALKGPDHPDHAATARFTRVASQAYSGPHRLVGYRDYESTNSPQNVFGTLLGAKAMAFYAYGQHDSGACASEPACAGSAYEEWLKRQYTVASETTGVVANAGFAQTTTPSAKVTLDGSGSSHTGSGTLNYAWTQTGGSTVALSGANTSAPSFTTPSHPTVLTFSLTVSDKTGSSKPDPVTVRVPGTDPTPAAVVGPEEQVSSSATVTLDGSESWDPNGLALQYAWIQTGGPTVTLSGSSTAGPTFTAPVGPASLTFALVVSNGTQTSAPATAEVKVAGIAPSFGSGTTTTLTTGVAGSFRVEAGGAPTPTIARTGTLPGGLSFSDNGDGTATLSGTPAASAAEPAQTASYPLTLTATNSEGKATQSFVLKVFNPGTAPSFKSGTTAGFTTAVAGSFSVQTDGAPSASLIQTAGTLPPGLTFADQGNGTAKISGTPTAAAAAPGKTQPYSVTLKAESAAGSATQTLTLNVTNPGSAAQITSGGAASFTTGVAASFTVTSSGAPTATLTRTGALPPGLTFVDNGDGTAKISGTATSAAAPPAESQAYPLTVKADNGVGSDSKPLTLTVTNPGTPPAFASGSSSSFTTGVAKIFTVEASGSPKPSLASTGTLPAGLSFKDNGDGTATISGTAADSAAPPNGSKQYALSFEATSKAGNKTQAFTLTVFNPGSAPVFESGAAASFTTGLAGSFTVQTTAAPTAALTKTAGELPPGLSFADQGDGSAKISGTPTSAAAPPGGSKDYAVTVHAGNGVGGANQTLTLTVSNPGVGAKITSPDSASFTTGVAASFTVTTSGLPAATLTRAGALPPGLSFADQGDGTAKISGTPTGAAAPPAQSQGYPITVEADNGVGHASQTLTIEVTNPGAAPSFSSAEAASFTTGASGSFVVATSGAPTAALSVTGTLPPGLSFLDRGDGSAKLSGTATAAASPPAQTTSYPVTVKAQNAVGQQTQTLTIEVTNPGAAPSFSSAEVASFTTGAAGSFVVATGGAPTAALSVTGALPPGLAFADNGDGSAKISGTPTAAASPPAQTTSYPVTVKAQNAVGQKTQTLTIKVTNPGATPVFTSAEVASFTTGTAASFAVTTSASPTATLTVSGTLPPGLAFADNGDGTAKITGTATAAASPPAQSRNYPVTVKAENAVSQKTQTLTIKVTNPGATPVFTSAEAASFTTGASGSFIVATSGAPTAALTLTGTLPSGLSFADLGDGTARISGTAANAAAPPAQSVDYPVTVKAENAVGQKTQTLTLKVTNPGAAPSFSSAQVASFTTGAAGSFAVATSAAPNAALTVSGTLPPGLGFADQGDGSAKFTGTPTAAASPPAQTTSYTVTVKAQNAVGQKTQALTIKVTNPGTAAAFTSANATTFTSGVAGSFTVSTSGAPAAAISKASGQLPSGVTLLDNGDGTATLAGTPARSAAPDGESQAYALALKASNGVGSPATQSFTLTVFNPGDAPFITSQSTAGFTTGAAGSFTVTSSGAPKPALSRTGDLPAGLAFHDNGDGTATISGTPAAGAAPAAGSLAYDLTIAADSKSGHSSKALKITVTNPGTAPQITSGEAVEFATGIAAAFTVTSSGDPVAALAAEGDLPAGLAFHDNGDGTATIAGTPALDSAPAGGSRGYAISVAATSGAGDASRPLTITVRRPADPPVEEPPQQGDPGNTGDSGNNGGGSAPPASSGGAQSVPAATSEPPPAVPQIALAQAKLQLPIGKPSRRVIAVEAPADAKVTCGGKLPRGLRCKVNKAGNLVVTVAGTVSVAGTYRVRVKVTRAGRTTRRTLKITLRAR
ncbi:MAG: PIG-L family deacetylase [Solirubrobacterales bacterium]